MISSDLFSVALLLVLLLIATGVGIFSYYDGRQHPPPANYYSLVGKVAVVVAHLERDYKGHYCYHLKINGELWLANSAEHFSLGQSCLIRAVSEDSLSLRI